MTLKAVGLSDNSEISVSVVDDRPWLDRLSVLPYDPQGEFKPLQIEHAHLVAVRRPLPPRLDSILIGLIGPHPDLTPSNLNDTCFACNLSINKRRRGKRVVAVDGKRRNFCEPCGLMAQRRERRKESPQKRPRSEQSDEDLEQQ